MTLIRGGGVDPCVNVKRGLTIVGDSEESVNEILDEVPVTKKGSTKCERGSGVFDRLNASMIHNVREREKSLVKSDGPARKGSATTDVETFTPLGLSFLSHCSTHSMLSLSQLELSSREHDRSNRIEAEAGTDVRQNLLQLLADTSV